MTAAATSLSPQQLSTIFTQHPQVLRKLEQTPELCMMVVKHNGMAIGYVLNQLPELCYAALTQCPEAIQWITSPTEDMWLYVLALDGLTIRFHKAPTEAMRVIAVKQNGLALKHIRLSDRTAELCAIAWPNCPAAIQFIPARQLTPEMWIQTLLQDGLRLQWVEEQTEALCLAAISQNWRAIRYAKEPTEDVCFAALSVNVLALKHIVNPTLKLCQFAHQRYGDEIFNYISPSELHRFPVREIVQDIRTVEVPISVNHKIVHKDPMTGRYAYVEKDGRSVLETIRAHANIFGGIDQEVTTVDTGGFADYVINYPLVSGLFLLKAKDTYLLYRKSVESKETGWLRTNLASCPK